MDKATLIDNIRRRQAAIEQTIAPLSERQMTTPGVVGEWSIRDVLAHIGAWERTLLGRLQAAINNTTPLYSWVPDGPFFAEASDEDVDIINERFYQQNKGRSLQDVMSEFRRLPIQLMDAVQQLSEDDLTNSERFAWTQGQPLWKFIPGDSYEHIDEHLASIREWLKNL